MAGSTDPTTFQHVFQFEGAPDTIPPYAGAHAVDTVNKKLYLSVGSFSVLDWKECSESPEPKIDIIEHLVPAEDRFLDIKYFVGKTTLLWYDDEIDVMDQNNTIHLQFQPLDLTVAEVNHYVGREFTLLADWPFMMVWSTDSMKVYGPSGLVPTKEDANGDNSKGLYLDNQSLVAFRLVEYNSSADYTFLAHGDMSVVVEDFDPSNY